MQSPLSDGSVRAKPGEIAKKKENAKSKKQKAKGKGEKTKGENKAESRTRMGGGDGSHAGARSVACSRGCLFLPGLPLSSLRACPAGRKAGRGARKRKSGKKQGDWEKYCCCFLARLGWEVGGGGRCRTERAGERQRAPGRRGEASSAAGKKKAAQSAAAK